MGSHGMNFGMSWSWVFWVLLILGTVVVAAVVMKALTGGRSAHPPGEDHRAGPLGRVSYMRNQTRIAASTTPARYVTASLS